ncbi:hypothetical protein BH10BDE1_BH10BDE1_27410 [soil metagenome]
MSRLLSQVSACFASLLLTIGLVPSAHAFKILSALTDGCHENITLGALGQTTAGFNGDGLPSVAPMLARMVARVESEGVPQDDASRGLRRETARRYGWGNLSEAMQFVLSSFIAGVRAPDTGGYSIVDFSQIRGSHIRDDQQPAHFLRRKEDNNAAGDVSAIQDGVTRIQNLGALVLSTWSSSGRAQRNERWTFAFYGEKDVTIFAPAFDMGLMAHAIEDSYAHALRDENDLKIIAVENYMDLVMNQYDGTRDGPGHSERLDQCNVHDSFDLPRIDVARKSTAKTFLALDAQMALNGTDLTAVTAVFDDIFAYKAGCDLSNQYCHGLWYQKAKEEISEPYEIGCGLMAPISHHHDHDGSSTGPGSLTTDVLNTRVSISASLLRNAMVFFMLVLLPLGVALRLRCKNKLRLRCKNKLRRRRQINLRV